MSCKKDEYVLANVENMLERETKLIDIIQNLTNAMLDINSADTIDEVRSMLRKTMKKVNKQLTEVKNIKITKD